ncbi:MAG: tRNA (adenosine(37)-N6)-threonylcarbamoyltransferase complex ATPase subunit type 1 TsaE [Bacteroidota bacterium]|jgi:hydrolase, P-loop family
MKKTYTFLLSDIDDIARQFVADMGTSKIFAFYGAMGAGKTTFIAALCKTLGVEEPVTSPTFAIVNQYGTVDGNTVYHFDCYRFDTLEDALNIGIEEYFDSGCLCFIEWAEKIKDILPTDTIAVNIVAKEDGSREVSVLQ